MTSKSAIKTACRNLATTGNRKQRRAQAITAYKKVMKYVKKQGIMNPDAAMGTTTPNEIGSDQDSTAGGSC